MNNNNTFLLLLKKEYVDNRKPLLLGVVGVLATYILMGGFLGNIQAGCGTEIFLFSFLGGLTIGIGASLAFSNMKTKEGRINTLMLPATTSQKFLLRWVAMVPMVLLLVWLGCLLGDTARVVVDGLDGIPARSFASWWGSVTRPGGDELKLVVTVVFMGILCTQSIYFFGAILWPKLSFIKTLAALQVIQLLGGIGLTFCNFNINFAVELTARGALWIVVVLGLAFCGVMYWLSYVRFKRSQVTYKLF